MCSIARWSPRRRGEANGRCFSHAAVERSADPGLNDAGSARIPRVEPIVPTSYAGLFDSPEWLFKVKYDSFRSLFYLSGRLCKFCSKRRNVLRRFEPLCYGARASAVHGT